MSERILRFPEVERRVGKSRSTIWRAVRDGDGQFPSPVAIGPRAIGWRESDIDAWLANLATWTYTTSGESAIAITAKSAES
jgi:prophage regulatory protein